MDMDKAVIVAGIGCRRGASAADIGAAITAALARVENCSIDLMATAAFKVDEAGIAAVARDLGVPLVLISQLDLERAGTRALSRSERVQAIAGLPSVAEAAALAAAGTSARLLVPRVTLGSATCALAESRDAP